VPRINILENNHRPRGKLTKNIARGIECRFKRRPMHRRIGAVHQRAREAKCAGRIEIRGWLPSLTNGSLWYEACTLEPIS
jgi:hypothetical protein